MVELFRPKFVDLVRNSTLTAGTGNFTLGAAVSGFTSFAAAVQAGDQFYYSVVHSDKPNEREIGRGTMLPDGTIARDPVQGPPVNFSNGSKSISLIAAAEWYNQIQQAPAVGAVSDHVASRSALAALVALPGLSRTLVEARREGLFKFDGSNLSARVAADPAQGVYVAPASDPSGASGAWVRKTDNVLRIEWFGGVADGVTDNLAAFNAMMAVAQEENRNRSPTNIPAGPECLLLGPKYHFSGTLELKSSVRLRGSGAGQPGGQATVLSWPANMCGIRVNRHDTSGESGPIASTSGADSSLIEGFILKSAGGTADLKKSGIHLRARAVVRDCQIFYFPGAGICIWAATDQTDWTYGNANNWVVERVRLQENKQSGLYVRGYDANAGLGVMVDASKNGRYGIEDRSFLGNTYVACHSDANGLTTNGKTSVVSDGAWRYELIDGQDASAASTAPTSGATNAVWRIQGPGSANSGLGIQAWSGAGAFESGGSYFIGGTNARSALLGCYHETAQANPTILSPSCAFGGLLAHRQPPTANDGAQMASHFGVMASQSGFKKATQHPATAVRFETELGGVDDYTILSSFRTDLHPDNEKFRLSYGTSGGTGARDVWFMVGNRKAAQITGSQTTDQFGTGTAQPGIFAFPKMAIGDGALGRIWAPGDHTTPPVPAGAHSAGEIIWIQNPHWTGILCWVCVTSGSPGTWVPHYVGRGVMGFSGNFTLDHGSMGSYMRFTNSSAATLTIPANATAAIPVGGSVEIEAAGTGSLTIAPAGGVTVNSLNGSLVATGRYARMRLTKVASDTWCLAMIGNAAAQGAAQADSVATDVAGLVADFNALLAKLRAAKIIAT